MTAAQRTHLLKRCILIWWGYAWWSNYNRCFKKVIVFSTTALHLLWTNICQVYDHQIRQTPNWSRKSPQVTALGQQRCHFHSITEGLILTHLCPSASRSSTPAVSTYYCLIRERTGVNPHSPGSTSHPSIAAGAPGMLREALKHLNIYSLMQTLAFSFKPAMLLARRQVMSEVSSWRPTMMVRQQIQRSYSKIWMVTALQTTGCNFPARPDM